jgi:hypothetical protein
MVISAGPSGKLQTTCGDTAAKGDNLFVVWTTAVTQNHAAVWQTVTQGTSVTGVEYGATGSKLSIDSSGNVAIPGALGVTGASSFAGGLSATSGSFNAGIVITFASFSGKLTGTDADLSGSLTAGSSSLSSLSVAGAADLANLAVTQNATIGGTLNVTGATTLTGLTAGTSTLDGLSVTHASALNGPVTTSRIVQIGTTAAAVGSSSPLLTVGKPLMNIYPFSVDQYGMVTAPTFSGDLVGSQSGGSVSATALTATGPALLQSTLEVKGAATFDSDVNTTGGMNLGGGLVVGGTTALNNALTGTSASFTGTVSATNFVGNLALGEWRRQRRSDPYGGALN